MTSRGTYLGRKRAKGKIRALYYIESANKGRDDWRIRSNAYTNKKEAKNAVAWLRKNEPEHSHRIATKYGRWSWP